MELCGRGGVSGNQLTLGVTPTWCVWPGLPRPTAISSADEAIDGLPDEAAEYVDHVRRRLAVKPGITGLWQVNGRSDLSWEESVRLDLRHVENWSLMLDLQILEDSISGHPRLRRILTPFFLAHPQFYDRQMLSIHFLRYRMIARASFSGPSGPDRDHAARVPQMKRGLGVPWSAGRRV
jgi:hypothetical protein